MEPTSHPALLFFNGIGDHLLALPSVRALAGLFPGRLQFVGLPYARATFFPDLDLGRVHELAVQDQAFDADALAAELGACDLLVCLNRAFSPSIERLLGRLAPAESIGFFPAFGRTVPFQNDRHAVDLAFDVPRLLDRSLRLEVFAAPPPLPEAGEALARRVRASLPQGCRLLVLHPDSAAEKMWPAARLDALLSLFLSRHPEFFVLVVGTRAWAPARGAPAGRVIPCHGLPLTTSMALVREADLFLGVDSCMLHAADLFRVPSVGLFRQGTQVEFGFRFGPHRHVFGRPSTEDIEVDEVLAALESFAPAPSPAPLRAAIGEDAVRRVKGALFDGIELRRSLAETQATVIADAASRITAALTRGGKLLLCGNGGSAADCQHIAAELTGRFRGLGRPALAAISITTDTSALTAIANDFGFEQVFARQVEALGRPGDVLLALSTSGRSENVLRAARRARERSMEVIALSGPEGGPLGDLADVVVRAPGGSPDRIQELHITVGHILCELIEAALGRGDGAEGRGSTGDA